MSTKPMKTKKGAAKRKASGIAVESSSPPKKPKIQTPPSLFKTLESGFESDSNQDPLCNTYQQHHTKLTGEAHNLDQ
eukprot:1356899-Amorphochlora_amoeboformis.AAC.2